MDTEGRIVREILRQNEFLLRRHLVLSKTVLDHLRSEGLLTEHSRRKIMLEPPHRQVGTLIQSLEYKGLGSMKKFLGILRETGHGWVADSLMDTDVTMDRLNRPTKPETSSLKYRDTSAATSSIVPPPKSLSEYRLAMRKSFDRPSVTAGHESLSTIGLEHRGMTLDSLLKAREPQPESMSRGFINTRDLLAVQTGAPPLYPELGQLSNQSNHHHHRAVGVGRGLHDVPSTLYDLNQAFATQEQQNQQAMNVLQQEETAIRQLLEQNARDQGQVRRKQAVVTDISHRLKDIHVRANAAYDPSPHPNIGRYRLTQLNQIPWSM